MCIPVNTEWDQVRVYVYTRKYWVISSTCVCVYPLTQSEIKYVCIGIPVNTEWDQVRVYVYTRNYWVRSQVRVYVYRFCLCFTNFQIDFGTVQTMCYFCFSIFCIPISRWMLSYTKCVINPSMKQIGLSFICLVFFFIY